MGRIGLAFRVFFKILSGTLPVDRLQALLAGSAATAPPAAASSPVSAPSPEARRSDAIGLLAALQREARFVDLVQEPLADYSDAQIGAAARDVLRDCHEVLSRMFALQPVIDAAENEPIETPVQVNAGRLRVSGHVTGEPPFRGRLVHHGWEATRCELPRWSGDAEAVHVIAPAEIECR